MNRIALVAAVLAVLGGGTALAQTLPDPAIVTLEVLDSAGAVVGQYQRYRQSMTVKVQKIPTLVGIYPGDGESEHFNYFQRGALYFPTTDCTGQAYVKAEQEFGTRPAVTMQTAKGKWRLYMASTSEFTQVAMASQMESQGACRPVRFPRPDYYSPALDPVNLNNKYAAPFTLR